MSADGELDSPTRRIRREAAEWVVRHDVGLTPAEQDSFLQWLAADPRHREWFARQSGSWTALDGLADWRPAHSAEPNPRLLSRGRRVWWRAPQVAALAVAACVAVFFVVRRVEPPQPSAPLLLERRVLADGSVAELNQDSEIEIRYTSGFRRVQLVRGGARFTVQKDGSRPFLVRAGGVEVRAVGTAFDVSLLSRIVEVVVSEGQVKVIAADAAGGGESAARVDAAPLLVAGHRARIARDTPDAAPQISPVSDAELRRLERWQPQLLDFSAVPLRRVVEEFNRLNRRQLVLLEADLGELPVVASFRSDNLDGFVELLVRTAGVAIERRNEEEIVLRRARP